MGKNNEISNKNDNLIHSSDDILICDLIHENDFEKLQHSEALQFSRNNEIVVNSFSS